MKPILPNGFFASGVACGIKKGSKPDLALFYSALPATSAGVFTANRIKAAPLLLSKKHLRNCLYHQAIIVNSGNANCFTGRAGFCDALETAKSLSVILGIDTKNVLVSSTGIIARRLDTGKIKKAIPLLVKRLSKNGLKQAACAILTTDTRIKVVSVKVKISGVEAIITGVAKGSGMISPNLATMLAYIFTDASISSKVLKESLRDAVNNSFNSITVDGCMSTNDTVVILANGASFKARIDTSSKAAEFNQGLSQVCLELAKMIVKDAEGASKFIQIKVKAARSAAQAKRAALAIANSNLFKTAVYGQNPNFGRIIASVGASGVDLDEKNLKIKVSSLKKKEISVEISLGAGKAEVDVYTSDLTPEYVKINAEYS